MPKQPPLEALQLSLADALIRTHALFVPLRYKRDVGFWQDAWVARWKYAVGGIKYQSGAKGSTGAKEAMDCLAAMIRGGLAQRTETGSKKTLRIKLTERGQQFAEAIVGYHDVRAVRESVVELHGHRRRLWSVPTDFDDGKSTDSPWLCEVDLVRESGMPRTWHSAHCIEDWLLPAMSRGWVESNCTGSGRVYYRVTDLGLCIVAEPGLVKVEVKLSKPVESLQQRYWDTLAGVACDPEPQAGNARDIGEIPLPESLMRLKNWREVRRRERRGLPPFADDDLSEQADSTEDDF